MKLRTKVAFSIALATLASFTVWFAWLHQTAMHQREAVAWIAGLENGVWRYDSQDSSLGFQDPSHRSPSNAAEALFGPEYVHDIEEVLISDRNLNGLDQISGLRGVKSLSIATQRPLDIATLASLPKLSYVSVAAPRIDSLAALEQCSHLNHVILSGPGIDAVELAALRMSRPDMQIQVFP